MRLLMEMREPGGEWQSLSALTPSDPPGSVVSHSFQGRDVYLFHCAHDHAMIHRSLFGLDHEDGPHRVVDTAALQPVATIWPGGQHSIRLRTESGKLCEIRWTCERDDSDIPSDDARVPQWIIPAYKYPMTVELLDAGTHEVVWSTIVEGPGVLQVPAPDDLGVSPVITRVKFADGTERQSANVLYAPDRE